MNPTIKKQTLSEKFHIFLSRWTCIPIPLQTSKQFGISILFAYLLFLIPTSQTLDSEFAIVFTRQENANQYSTICFQSTKLSADNLHTRNDRPSKELDWAMCNNSVTKFWTVIFYKTALPIFPWSSLYRIFPDRIC